jgi:ABC-type sugar transport system ATPase subunit
VPEASVEVRHVTKNYEPVRALTDVSLTVCAREGREFDDLVMW